MDLEERRSPSKHEIEVLRAQTFDVACTHVLNAAYRSYGGVVHSPCMGFAWQTSYDRSRNDLDTRSEEPPVRTAVKTEIARAHSLG